MFALPHEAIGAIVAALIAGLVAFFSLIISKEQTVSAFRQAWVDALRQDIAAVVSCVHEMHASKGELKGSPCKHPNGNTFCLPELAARIRLRLNPDEQRPKEKEATIEVLNALSQLESISHNGDPQNHRLDVVKLLVSNAQTVLKENWNLIRSGERMYRIVKGTTLGIIGLAAALSLWLTYF